MICFTLDENKLWKCEEVNGALLIKIIYKDISTAVYPLDRAVPYFMFIRL